jgi:hypothetical protein
MARENLKTGNKLLVIALLLFAIGLGSCKKKPKYHHIRFELRVIEQSKYGIVTPIYLSILPHYQSVPPKLESRAPITWNYDYMELKDGDKIYFAVDIPLSTYYEKWIYIDGKEVAYKRIKVSDIHYYENTILEQRGYDDVEGWGVEYKE